jgi:hypothetical protein
MKFLLDLLDISLMVHHNMINSYFILIVSASLTQHCLKIHAQLTLDLVESVATSLLPQVPILILIFYNDKITINPSSALESIITGTVSGIFYFSSNLTEYFVAPSILL